MTSQVRLSEILQPVRRVELVEPSQEYRLLGIRLYGGGLFEKASLPGYEIKAEKLNRVRAGDFVYSRLFAWKGSFAAAGPDHDDCYVSNEFPTFETGPRVDASYLALYMRQHEFWAAALEKSSGSTPTSRNRLKEEDFLRLTVPLPPLDEQKRIVEAAHYALTLCKGAEALHQRSAEISAKLWPRAARDYFDALSEPRLPLSELVELRGGGTPAKSEPRYWEGGDVPWITPKDMKTPIIESSLLRITELAAATTSARPIEPGAVLVVVRGMILARHVPVAVLRIPAAINQDMKALMTRDERLLPDYLAAALEAFNTDLSALVERSTHDTRKLQTERLMDFRIPLPPVERQHQVVGDLELLRQKLDAVRWIAGQNERLLQAVPGAVVRELLSRAS